VTGFEYSRPRASFGREHLALDILEEYDQIDAVPDNSYDVIFTNHVLEHLPDLKVAFRLFARLQTPGGTLVMVIPNGSGPTAMQLGAAMISQEHVTSLTAEFFDRNVADYGFTLRYMTEPYSGAPQDYAQINGAPEDLPGKELVVIAQHADG
jgi:2-polyprenyl-3-methyl-5-hydroxy-6-metoxy-1,4-benzoquinol methylase